jgi:hypothetical protein
MFWQRRCPPDYPRPARLHLQYSAVRCLILGGALWFALISLEPCLFLVESLTERAFVFMSGNKVLLQEVKSEREVAPQDIMTVSWRILGALKDERRG